MKIQIIKKKAASLKELGKEVIDIPEVSTLKELLIVVFYHEYHKIYNQKMRVFNEKEIKQLSRLGKISFSSLYNEDRKDLDELIEIMLQDFRDGLYRVYIHEQEYTHLDDFIQLQENDDIVFIRFVMLSGRLW